MKHLTSFLTTAVLVGVCLSPLGFAGAQQASPLPQGTPSGDTWLPRATATIPSGANIPPPPQGSQRVQGTEGQSVEGTTESQRVQGVIGPVLETETVRFTNPLEFDTITGFLIGIIEIILIFALPVVVLFIIYAGFLYVAAQGDETKLTTARSALTWAIVGGVIVLGALQIVALIEGTIEAL